MAIFQTSGQAVHFSYVIQGYDATPQSQMARIMHSVMRQLGISDGAGLSSIDLAGLTPLEVRGQCAMIRACVRSHLRPMEAKALEARYSSDRDTKRFAISALADCCGPVVGINPSVALALMWRQHVDRSRKKDFTLRMIATEYGLSKSTIHRAEAALKQHLGTLENLALSNLHARFVADGIIEGDPG
ncbi:hypothetical protein AAKU55_005272 [Oxalobacteraceae bacterium GrIS 1.11]